MTKPAPQKLGGRSIAFAVLFTLAGFASKAQTGVVLQSSFETSNMKDGGFQVLEGCCSYSLAQSSAQKRSGSTSMRVELRKTDPEAQYGNKRAELTHNNYSTESQVNKNLRIWAWSNYWPKASNALDNAEEIFAQWHDKNPSKSTSPALAFEIKNGRYRIVIRYSTTNYVTNPNIVVKYFDLGPVSYDKWNDWVVNYNPSYNSDGFVRIYLNGTQVLNYSGPCHYNGSWFPYFKLGIYKWLWMGSGSSSSTTQRVWYVDDVKIGDTRSVVADFLKAPTGGTNPAPTVNAGSNQALTLPTNSAALRGTATDADGVASYKWTQTSGPSTSAISNSTTANATAANLVAGTYNYRLTCTDTKGASSYDDVAVTVATGTSIGNKVPVVSAGTAKTITLPTNSAALAGTATDADGTIASYKWAQVSGPGTATFNSTTVKSVTVSKLVAGTYTFRLTATDNKGASASATTTVTVKSATTGAPTVSAGSAITVTLPTSTATLRGSASDADGIASYKWAQVSGPSTATFNSTTALSVTVSKLVAGTYTFRLTATDRKGIAASATVTVTVKSATSGTVFSVSPTSVTKDMTLTLTDTYRGKGTMRVYSNSGVLIYTFPFDKTAATFTKVYSLGYLYDGTYIISVQYEGQAARTIKIQKI